MNVIKYPHPTLRHKSKQIRRVDSELKAMVRQMFDVMYAHEGLGLAANQVDLPYRLFVMNVDGGAARPEAEMVFINPVITERKGQATDREGCLSFPEIYAPVTRPEKISLNAYDLSGNELRLELSGLAARAVQHEIDHLDGVLFIDRLTPANLLAIRRDLDDLEQAFASDRRLGLIGDDQAIATRLRELEKARA